eukprot:798055-Prymnesium_polylepis.1
MCGHASLALGAASRGLPSTRRGGQSSRHFNLHWVGGAKRTISFAHVVTKPHSTPPSLSIWLA